MTEFNQVANIKVFGVGGGGSNAVNRMVADGGKRCRILYLQHRCTGNEKLTLSE